jgi:hypothetical protein
MAKLQTHEEHDPTITADCESVLVTLLSRLGPWKDSVYLVGGLAPRYLVEARPPEVPAHAGTSDVDVVVDMALLADTDAYATLEENLTKIGFTRVTKPDGKRVNWRWQILTDNGNTIVLEFLSWDPNRKVAAAQELPTPGNITAINIPHADIVFDMHDVREISAPLLGGDGNATVTVRYANLVSFLCLKALALDHRSERKDAHDLVYCIEFNEDGVEGAISKFQTALQGPHKDVVAEAIRIVRAKFADDKYGAGYLKDGPTMAARFEHGNSTEPELLEAVRLRQREINGLIETFLFGLG